MIKPSLAATYPSHNEPVSVVIAVEWYFYHRVRFCSQLPEWLHFDALTFEKNGVLYFEYLDVINIAYSPQFQEFEEFASRIDNGDCPIAQTERFKDEIVYGALLVDQQGQYRTMGIPSVFGVHRKNIIVFPQH